MRFLDKCPDSQLHADETTLSRFNTTSDQASTYPMLISLGLLPAQWRLKPAAYELLAFLPRLLKRLHKKKSTEAMADLKRQLTWLSMADVLAPLDVVNVSDNGYRFASCLSVVVVIVNVWWVRAFVSSARHIADVVPETGCSFLGRMAVGTPAVERNVFLVPLLYIAGMIWCPRCCCANCSWSLLPCVNLFSDLPEVRRLCGIVKCPDCAQKLHSMRRDVDHEDIKAEAIAILRNVGKGAAVALLDTVDMAASHLHCDCPFMGRIAHMTPGCFPGDRLHLQ